MKGATVRDLLKTLVDGLDRPAVSTSGVILPWACPVPFFGDLSASTVATVGINPSNREFVDANGKELEGVDRRFHTLGSLGLRTWGDVDDRHLSQISEACRNYFWNKPYDKWFGILDKVVAGAGASFKQSGGRPPACHLDLVPYATDRKWSKLTSVQHRSLFDIVPDNLLGLLLRDSPVRILILNGQAVVERFETIAGLCLKSWQMPAWSLSWSSHRPRPGRAYWGAVETLCGVELRKMVTILGYNHNLQGTFGMRSEVIDAIGNWISKRAGPKPTTTQA